MSEYDKSRILAMLDKHRETAASNIYAECPVQNFKEVYTWAREICPVPIKGHEMHCTVMYSRDFVDLSKVKPGRAIRIGPSRDRRLLKLGDATVIALGQRESDALRATWLMFTKAGASWDFPTYLPHVSISYDWKVSQGELNLINAYEGPLEFGPYRIEPIKD